ncbi:alpha-hydroxy-acid oxidizing protein [Salinisphaera sp. Q1T1-3]|uniref:alpha-hydroxy-acid oxidizing protein n=1 Tax=Salinisphaera sp. Q1T1-3 TaxID=2321229 RepID=UPI000E76D51E|nr:alpha-hydroxy-acid oxidizing protein [Salinisphaera sp. Q1T1-3]RJS93294.1 lactate 2-monooxygenase [Salinisphaera sp. Q1T1-3]
MAEPPPTTGTHDRQQAIYRAGLAGHRPRLPITHDALAARAQRRLSARAHAYIAGGAGDETTVAANRRAFDEWRLVPRMLRDIAVRDTAISLFGHRYPQPFLLAPIGALELAHRSADVGVAEAAARTGVPMIFSNQAGRSMEACTAAMRRIADHAPRWFQLYWPKSDALAASLVARAEACGCDALVVTLDTPLLGWRPRDLALGHLPFLRGQGLAQYTHDPVFRDLLAHTPADTTRPPITPRLLANVLASAYHYPGSTWQALRRGHAAAAIRQFIATYSRPDLTWTELERLREMTRLPILLKGVLSAADARAAAAAGIDGLVVSNHGGRQVDGALASLDALPAIRAAAPDLRLVLDSGVRTGADIVKALALGADAVAIGRPYAYALALGGADGVAEWIANTAADFALSMALAGATSVADIHAGAIELVPRTRS